MAIDFEQYAIEPKKASNSNGSMERHSLKELIDADRYDKTQKSVSSKTKSVFAMGNTKCIPPSAR